VDSSRATAADTLILPRLPRRVQPLFRTAPSPYCSRYRLRSGHLATQLQHPLTEVCTHAILATRSDAGWPALKRDQVDDSACHVIRTTDGPRLVHMEWDMRSLQIIRGFVICLGLILGPSAFTVAAQRMIAIASIFPVADIVQQVGGAHWEVLTLLPAGASAHTYEPTPAQVRQFTQADVFFQIGLGLEFWLEKLVRAAKHPTRVGVDLSEGIATIPMPSPALSWGLEKGPRREFTPRQRHSTPAERHIHADTGPDAHYWLDPLRMLQVVSHVEQEITRLDPEHARQYAERAQRVRTDLAQLDAEIRQRTEGLQNRRFIALHAAWTYFAPRYNLVQAAVVEPFPGREPSPRYLAGLAALMRREQVHAVVIEPQLSTTAAQALARETGARVGLMDPYGGPGVPGRESYMDLMRYNSAELVKLLE
jgi:zinc transport system substrate-binding protein